MHRVLLVGGGKIGRTIARFLSSTRDYTIRVVDADARALDALPSHPRIESVLADGTDRKALLSLMRDRDTVVSGLGYRENPLVAETALEAGASYFDLTEDIATTEVVRALAKNAKPGQIFVPQCGLAPGFVGIAGHSLAKRLESIDMLSLRVGALPLYPTNALKYALTWSTDGLINEYCNPCDVISEGRRREIPALEGLEEISIDGVRYEAFHTSGGLGTLAETLEGRVRELDFKTLRYPGHRDRMQFLLRDMRLSSRRELLRELLEQAVPMTTQDVVVVLCEARGMRGGSYEQLSDARKIYGRRVDGEDTSAIQITSAASLCVMLDLHVARLLPRQGFVRQEQVDLDIFLGSRFGRYFDSVRPLSMSGAQHAHAPSSNPSASDVVKSRYRARR